MRSLLALWLMAGPAPLVLAHEGHGMGAVHWHATDTLGFVTLGVIVGVAWWATRRK
jgi:hypothetical protein